MRFHLPRLSSCVRRQFVLFASIESKLLRGEREFLCTVELKLELDSCVFYTFSEGEY